MSKTKEFEPVRYMRTLGFTTREAEAWIEDWNKARHYLLRNMKECRHEKERKTETS